MIHHTTDAICPCCEDKLTRAHPFFKDWFYAKKTQDPTLHISCSDRGKEDQEKAYKEGKSRLHYPNSPHNKMGEDEKPESLALDLFQLVNGKAVFSGIQMAKLSGDCKAKNEPILWGGEFKSLGDFDHFQFNPNVLKEVV